MEEPKNITAETPVIPQEYKENVLEDFAVCCLSREVSITGRKEVLTGKAKFGIVGDGKELPQIAMARHFKKGDFRSGYYRDQTFMMALGECSVENFFAQLYADPVNDIFSGGRQMNSHFATPMIDKDNNWLATTNRFNVSSDISSTGGQMARAFGLAFASRKFREVPFDNADNFSNEGNEISFVTIGDASTSEGVFWETINAACVSKVPLVVCVWDDGYGISVPIDYQTTKRSISKALNGFRLDENGDGLCIYEVKAWDYPGLMETFERATSLSRKHHVPALIHVQEVTQPQGHSTSGSHERYKSKERLEFEKNFDCIEKMASWILDKSIATEAELSEIRETAKSKAKQGRENAWNTFLGPLKIKNQEILSLLDAVQMELNNEKINQIIQDFKANKVPAVHEMVKAARQISFHAAGSDAISIAALQGWVQATYEEADGHYHSGLYADGSNAAINIKEVKPQISSDSEVLNGYEILNKYFDGLLQSNSKVLAFGEDVGQIGDVNQGFAGLQAKYGEERVFDVGIREWTIVGQSLGLAMRGWRPITEIQYLDYLIYGLQPMTDDIATLRYRSDGLQQAPVIIRTRGHRLEGIWHAGSPMGMLIHSLRGMYLMVPRNMTQAVGFYNTLIQSVDPGVIIECLNGYRLKETCPENLDSFTVPLGVPEVLTQGNDITLVTYGSCIRVAEQAVQMLADKGISVELIDAQTLLPFDVHGLISSSLAKTNRLVVMDEDVPGGATSYMLQQILEVQKGYQMLDAAPVTITAHPHRPPYGSDGDYFTKPNVEDVYTACYQMMNESSPSTFPEIPTY